MEIYPGKAVKSQKIKDTILEILRIDDYTESVYCVPLNSIDGKVVEIQIEDLEEV